MYLYIVYYAYIYSVNYVYADCWITALVILTRGNSAYMKKVKPELGTYSFFPDLLLAHFFFMDSYRAFPGFPGLLITQLLPKKPVVHSH